MADNYSLDDDPSAAIGELPPNGALPPPTRPPANQIDWRPMLINWAGSMLFLGLLAPILVWLAVYWIRVRKRRRKPQPNDGIKKDHTPRTGGMAMGFGSEKPGEKMRKRDHFCRYIGWWSMSAAGSVKGRNSTSDEHPQNDRPKTRVRNEPPPPPWGIGGQFNNPIYLEGLAELGEITRPMPSIQEVLTPKEERTRSSDTHAKALGKQEDTQNQQTEISMNLMAGGRGSDSTDNNTVRKRTVRAVKPRPWVDTSPESCTSPNLDGQVEQRGRRRHEASTPSRPALDLDFHVHEDGTTLVPTPTSKGTSETKRSPQRPKLRKVFSSPSLHNAFQRSAKSHDSDHHHHARTHRISAPILLSQYRNQLDGADADTTVTGNKDSQNLLKTSRVFPLSRSPERHTKPVTKGRVSMRKFCKLPSEPRSKKQKGTGRTLEYRSNQSFSWDVTRKSSLDVPGSFKSKLGNCRAATCTSPKSDRENEAPRIESNALDDYEAEDELLDGETSQDLGYVDLSAATMRSISYSVSNFLLLTE